MGKLSRKGKLNIPGKVCSVIMKEKLNDKLWKSCCFLLTRHEGEGYLELKQVCRTRAWFCMFKTIKLWLMGFF